MNRIDDLARISQALDLAAEALEPFTAGAISSTLKNGGDPLTAADTAVNDALLAELPRGDEGWLSEEAVDDRARLDCRRVWIVGSVESGVTLNGVPVQCAEGEGLAGALVLASRSEVGRGEWNRFFGTDISVRNMGSVAYKLGLVAAGLADATWALVPKNEWDVAGGAALVRAAGGDLRDLSGQPRQFNQADPLLDGFVATRPGLGDAVRSLLDLSAG